MIYQHKARGAKWVITDGIDKHVNEKSCHDGKSWVYSSDARLHPTVPISSLLAGIRAVFTGATSCSWLVARHHGVWARRISASPSGVLLYAEDPSPEVDMLSYINPRVKVPLSIEVTVHYQGQIA